MSYRPPKIGITTRMMLRQFGPDVNLKAGDGRTLNFVAMDVGRYHLKPSQKQDLINYLAQLQRDGYHNLSLVPRVCENNCIFFADIDAVPENVELKDLIDTIITCFNDVTGKDPAVTDEDVIIFKREDADKYHIYIPVVTSKATRKAVIDAVNVIYTDLIDTAASTIRCEGFLKFDKERKEYIPGSRYLHVTSIPDDGSFPTLAEPDEEVLGRVWLEPKGWNADASMNGPINAARGGQGALLNDDNNAARGGQGVLLNDDNNAEGNQAESQETSPDAPFINSAITPEIVDRIQTRFPLIARSLWRYPIKSISSLGNRNWGFNMKGKSQLSRTCKIKGVVHKSSNIWLNFNQHTNVLKQNCYSAGCIGKSAILQAPGRYSDSIAASEYKLPEATDAALAEHFKYWKNGGIAVQDGVWYEYRQHPGYWVKCTLPQVQFWIMQEFKDYLEQKFQAAMEKDQVNGDSIALTWNKIQQQLTSVKGIKQISEALSWLLQNGETIEWNKNPYYTVFPNGVLQLDKRDPDQQELYHFGKTDPEEYVNDRYCMKVPFNCPPVAEDLGYLRKAEDLLKNWFKVVQPEEEDRKLLLTYMSLAFKAKNYKKMVVNIGENGNNAKSSTFEFLIFVFGKYGLIGDKNLIVKGGNTDKVSIAKLDCVRFVLFEEPDPSKPFNVEFLKDLVGGAETIVGRLNYSNNNIVELHCKTALNANSMTQIKLEKAVEERLLYFAWKTIFTNKPAEVDHQKRIYKANPDYKTKEYWLKMADGLIWLLLIHYRLFENNDHALPISEDQFARTRAELMESDQFIKWFGANFVFLAATQDPPAAHHFVTVEEVQQEFRKLTPKEQQTIIGSKHYHPDKFITDILKGHSALRDFWTKKVTNWRLTAAERRLVRNRIGPNGQYQRAALIRFMARAEFDMNFDGLLEQRLGMTDRAYQQQQQELNDELLDDELLNDEQEEPHSQEEKDDELLNDEPVKDQAARPDIKADDYIYSDELFFTYGADVLPEPPAEIQSDDDDDVEMANNGSGDNNNTDNAEAIGNDNEDKKDNEDDDDNNDTGAGVNNNSGAISNDNEDKKDNEDNNDTGAGVKNNSGAVGNDNDDEGGVNNNSGAVGNDNQDNNFNDADYDAIMDLHSILDNSNNAEENDDNDDDTVMVDDHDDEVTSEISFSSFTTPTGSMVGFNADTGSTGSNSANMSGHKRIRITHKAGEELRKLKKQRR